MLVQDVTHLFDEVDVRSQLASGSELTVGPLETINKSLALALQATHSLLGRQLQTDSTGVFNAFGLQSMPTSTRNDGKEVLLLDISCRTLDPFKVTRIFPCSW